eukprot:Gregarina_sp_Pseudo_9__2328@NODE_2641_length_925_cov_42_024831_g2422_i0_p1_GENE_NODE_2641_length_925_cov_42_024831_g2422_i0NODE_2641_length_925_cov_42_024831_g2422_i0_p1_ORF_typecomplete_len260_score38_70_NODE_2641_length_925_cov_42_024831_g2422_i069848
MQVSVLLSLLWCSARAATLPYTQRFFDSKHVDPPPLTRIPDIIDGHEDLYLASNLPFGLYSVPTWVGVQSASQRTNLTNAHFIWKSGMNWFTPWDSPVVRGRFIGWHNTTIEVVVMLEGQGNIVLKSVLKRKFGCWSDWDFYKSRPFVDRVAGEEWPSSGLLLQWKEKHSQVFGLYSDEHHCLHEGPFTILEVTCDRMYAEIDNVAAVWPNRRNCKPFSNYATRYFDFSGSNGTMTLKLGEDKAITYRGSLRSQPFTAF